MSRKFSEPKHVVAAALVGAMVVFVVYESFSGSGALGTGASKGASAGPGSPVTDASGNDYKILNASWGAVTPEPTTQPIESPEKRDLDPRLVRLQTQLEGMDVAFGRPRR